MREKMIFFKTFFKVKVFIIDKKKKNVREINSRGQLISMGSFGVE